MPFTIVNTHTRSLPTDSGIVDQMLSKLGTPDDQLWPAEFWFPMELDRSPDQGGAGGHGPVRYHCVERETGRVRFQFDDVLGAATWQGYHQFTVEPLASGSALRHVIRVRVPLWNYIQWLLMVRPLHDAVLEDLLDKAEGIRRARWSWWVRVLRKILSQRDRSVPSRSSSSS